MLPALRLKDDLQVYCLYPVVEESIAADLMEPCREHMHQETADKFRMFQRDVTFFIPRFYPFGRKSNGILSDGQYPAFRDGDLMGAAAKIFNGIAKTVEGLLDKRVPVFSIKWFFELFGSVRISQMGAGGRKDKGTALPEGNKGSHELTLKFIQKDPDRDKEPARGEA